MRTTLDLNDDLLARAKAEAARQRTSLTRLIERGLAHEIANGAAPPEPPRSFGWKVFGDAAATPLDPAELAARIAADDERWARKQAGLEPFDAPDT